ncbi:LOW QUALITY PROTEIN: tissue factor [Motacilla alba alba]|uniref:LOW QUALITY PROTEIN: tissue factor n=1 Tax=Motacilla alba alba TaxID=1094192 RepID=UPI0018D51CC4|nr:LOW QUALITY PROTEIN: tissue factor [Motacilla alba alba]
MSRCALTSSSVRAGGCGGGAAARGTRPSLSAPPLPFLEDPPLFLLNRRCPCAPAALCPLAAAGRPRGRGLGPASALPGHIYAGGGRPPQLPQRARMLRSAAPPQALLLGALLWHQTAGYQDLATAVNITWSSINFKTILQWQPKPSGYFYTVEIHGQTSDVKRKCILTSETECDVTDALRNVKETYTAHILSVKPAEMDNFEEPPFTVSEKFTPYIQTVIGKPEIKDYSQNGSKLNVAFEDPLTPYRSPDGSFLTIQDIFQHDLEYKLYYWKDQSSGKKDVTTKSHNFEVSVDSGKNYCFYVQGIIPSRRENRNGQESKTHCTSVGRNILDEYGTEVFIILAVIAVAVITLAIALPVVLCKRKKAKKARAVREKELLNGV